MSAPVNGVTAATDSSPADIAPSAGEMNYAIAVIGAVWLFAVSYWFFPKIGGKTFFT